MRNQRTGGERANASLRRGVNPRRACEHDDDARGTRHGGILGQHPRFCQTRRAGGAFALHASVRYFEVCSRVGGALPKTSARPIPGVAIVPIGDYYGSVDEAVKRDDIRGVYGKDIGPDFARALGRSLAEVLRCATPVEPVNVVVGHDMRLSGPVLAEALSQGLTEGGCRPVQMGLAGTELVGFLPAHYSDVIDGGVMITASHNPPEENGFKFFGRGGQPLSLAPLDAPSGEEGLGRMASSIKKSRIPERLKWEDFAPDYIQTVLQKGELDFERAVSGASEPMRIAVEAGNGMGGRILREFARIAPQFEWSFSNETPDGRFPRVMPNPLSDEYQRMVAELVRRTGSHVGMCFDGDADRVALADENGEMLSPPLLAALIGGRLREKLGPGAKTAFNLECSWVVPDSLGDRASVTGDGPAVMVPVGYGRIKAIMRRNPEIAFGAEHSGHYMFREFYTADSGMLAGLMVLELAAELHARGKTLSSELEEMRRRYHGSGEVNFQLPPERPVEHIIAEAVARFKGEAQSMYAVAADGVRLTETYPPSFELAATDVRVEAQDWWFCMRESGTEGDLCRLYVESDGDRGLMERKLKALVELVGPEFRTRNRTRGMPQDVRGGVKGDDGERR